MHNQINTKANKNFIDKAYKTYCSPSFFHKLYARVGSFLQTQNLKVPLCDQKLLHQEGKNKERKRELFFTYTWESLQMKT